MTIENVLQYLELSFLLFAVCASFYTAVLLRTVDSLTISLGQLSRAVFVLAGGFLVMGVGHLHMQYMKMTGTNLFQLFLGAEWGHRLWLVALSATWLLLCIALVMVLRLVMKQKLAEQTAQLIAENEKLHSAANQDQLTGVGNRRFFEREAAIRLDQAKESGQKVSLLMLDLDRFKSINDQFGHAAGDQVLVAFGQVLRRCLRKEDLLARIGGEEFVVLLTDMPRDKLTELTIRILNEARRVEIYYGQEIIKFTTSIGVLAEADPAEATLKQLCGIADQALYSVKESGRDHFKVASLPV